VGRKAQGFTVPGLQCIGPRNKGRHVKKSNPIVSKLEGKD